MRRLPATTLKRLAALEKMRGTHRPLAMFPRIISVDDWERLAFPMQRILKVNVIRDSAPDYGHLPAIELVAGGV